MIESVIKVLPILLIGLFFVCLVIEAKLSMDTKKNIENMNVDFENIDKIMAKIEKDINTMGKTIDDFQETNNTIKKIIVDIQEKNNTNYGRK